MVNQQILQGNWNEIRGKLREKWGELTNDDVHSFNGNVDQLIGAIQRKTGESRESIENYLGSVSNEFAGTLDKTRAAVQEYATQTRQVAQQQYEQASEAMRGGYRSAQHMVQSRPAESLATAFGVGLVAGLVIGLVSRR